MATSKKFSRYRDSRIHFIIIICLIQTFITLTGEQNQARAACSPHATNFTLAPNSQSVTVNSPITTVSPTPYGVSADFSISPTLPAGLTLDTQTGDVSGTPTSTSPLDTYTITLTPKALCTIASTSTFQLEVTAAAPPPPPPPLPPAPAPDPIQNSNIISYFPERGPEIGGTVVTVKGNFPTLVTNIAVDLNNIEPSRYLQTTSEIQITMPPHPIGAVLIRIFNGRLPLMDSLAFTYEPVVIPTPEPTPTPTPEPTPEPTPTPSPMPIHNQITSMVGFKFAHSELLKAAVRVLDTLKLRDFTTVTISGYAQNNHWVGDLPLSIQRAKNVVKYLKLRYPQVNFQVKGFGEKRNPMCDEFINKCVVIKAQL